jgi:LCP family protein required for cell wall assembly
MKTKKNYTKYIIIAFAIIFLITAILLCAELWERSNGTFSGSDADDGIIEYDGKEYVRNENIETFLVLGLDRYEGATSSDSHESGVQADFLMLFVFDNENKKCTALHINRDTMTKVNKLAVGGTSVVDTYTSQIALAYNYVNDDNDKIRCGNTKASVEHLLSGAKVNHYLAVTMDAVPAINDLVGGVELVVRDDFTGIDPTLIKGESVKLTGAQALTYVRSRYGLEDASNSTRMLRQQQYVNALYDKALSCMEADESFVIKMVEKTDDYVVYDSSNQKMQTFAEKFKNYEFLGIREIAGESKAGEEFVEFYPDEKALKELTVSLVYKEKK